MLLLQIGDLTHDPRLLLGDGGRLLDGRASDLEHLRHRVHDEAGAGAVDGEDHDALPVVALHRLQAEAAAEIDDGQHGAAHVDDPGQEAGRLGEVGDRLRHADDLLDRVDVYAVLLVGQPEDDELLVLHRLCVVRLLIRPRAHARLRAFSLTHRERLAQGLFLEQLVDREHRHQASAVVEAADGLDLVGLAPRPEEAGQRVDQLERHAEHLLDRVHDDAHHAALLVGPALDRDDHDALLRVERGEGQVEHLAQAHQRKEPIAQRHHADDVTGHVGHLADLLGDLDDLLHVLDGKGVLLLRRDEAHELSLVAEAALLVGRLGRLRRPHLGGAAGRLRLALRVDQLVDPQDHHHRVPAHALEQPGEHVGVEGDLERVHRLSLVGLHGDDAGHAVDDEADDAAVVDHDDPRGHVVLPVLEGEVTTQADDGQHLPTQVGHPVERPRAERHAQGLRHADDLPHGRHGEGEDLAVDVEGDVLLAALVAALFQAARFHVGRGAGR